MIDTGEVGWQLWCVVEVVIVQHLWQGRVTYPFAFRIDAFEPYVFYLTECSKNGAVFGQAFLNDLGF